MPGPFNTNEAIVTVVGKYFYRPIVTAWAFAPTGTTYYVSSGGSDSNTGLTRLVPFLTIAKAISVATTPGDCIKVMAGTYREQVVFGASGTSGNPIILTCDNDALGLVKVQMPQAVIEASSAAPTIKCQTRTYIWINGLIIQGPLGESYCPANEDFTQCGITFMNGGGVGCQVTNCVIYGNLHCGIKEMNHGGTGILIEGNAIYSNGNDGFDHGIYVPSNSHTIRGNILYGNTGYAIHAYATPASLVINRNLCVMNGGGIILGGASGLVYNNVCYKNTNDGIFYFRGGCTLNAVKNNIASLNGIGTGGRDCGYDNGGGNPLLGDPTLNTDDYNDYYTDGVSPYLAAQNTVGANNLNSDPLFNDPDNGDFRLQSTSPCKATGLNLVGFTNRGAFGDVEDSNPVPPPSKKKWPRSKSSTISRSRPKAGP